MKKPLAIVAGVVGSLLAVGSIAIGYGMFANKSKTDASKSTSSSTTKTETGSLRTAQHKWLPDYPRPIQDDYFNAKLSKKMAKKADEIFKHLSYIENEAVRNYTGVNNVSAYLKGKVVFDAERSKTLSSYVEAISKLIDRNHLEEDVCLFHGTALKFLDRILFSSDDISKISCAADEAGVDAIIKNLNGRIFGSSNFRSTSTSWWRAMNFADPETPVLLIIDAKRGLGYLPIMNHSICRSEDEVLLNRYLKLKVNNAVFKVKPCLFPASDRCLILECETVV